MTSKKCCLAESQQSQQQQLETSSEEHKPSNMMLDSRPTTTTTTTAPNTSQFEPYSFTNYPLNGTNIANVWLSYLKSLQMNYLSSLVAAAATATTTTQLNRNQVVVADSPPQSIESNETPLDLSFKSSKKVKITLKPLPI